MLSILGNYDQIKNEFSVLLKGLFLLLFLVSSSSGTLSMMKNQKNTKNDLCKGKRGERFPSSFEYFNVAKFLICHLKCLV